MKKYKITLNKDWSYLINHIIVTNLIEKGTNNFSVKSYKSSQRQMEIITNKEINQVSFEKDYKTFVLKAKIEEIPFEPVLNKKGEKVSLTGKLQYSITDSKTNKTRCPIDFLTGKLVEEEKLLTYLQNNTGLKNIIINRHKVEPKTELETGTILYNKFEIDFSGTIENEDLFHRSLIQNIGGKKSYGLGAMFLVKD